MNRTTRRTKATNSIKVIWWIKSISQVVSARILVSKVLPLGLSTRRTKISWLLLAQHSVCFIKFLHTLSSSCRRSSKIMISSPSSLNSTARDWPRPGTLSKMLSRPPTSHFSSLRAPWWDGSTWEATSLRALGRPRTRSGRSSTRTAAGWSREAASSQPPSPAGSASCSLARWFSTMTKSLLPSMSWRRDSSPGRRPRSERLSNLVRIHYTHSESQA